MMFRRRGELHADAFETFAEQVLVPELKPGHVAIMDDLRVASAHASEGGSKRDRPSESTCRRTAPI